MDYLKTYKSFIHSQNLSEGIRITTGVLLPAFMMSYFSMLATGILISSGALMVSVADSPGPIHHRRNGMIVCAISIFLVTLLSGFFARSPVLMAIFLLVASFFYSMIGVYGARAGSIGTASLIILTLSIDPRLKLSTTALVFEHSLWITSGSLWYLCFSMLLYSVRPYRLAQQALGDFIQSTAEYLLIRSELYNKEVNYENTYKRLLQQQAEVQHKLTDVSELLFKTRSIIKESTNTGRTLVMMHLDVTDIFERIMMSHQRYSNLHKYFDETDILNDYHLLVKELAKELDEVGIAVKSGDPVSLEHHLHEMVTDTKEKFEKLRASYLKPDNIEGFISLSRVLENVEDLSERLFMLKKYTHYNINFKKPKINDAVHEKLISSQKITPEIFLNNLTLKSDTFRHSLRMSIAVITGFAAAQFFKIGHSYWVLLTIIVILKPAFSLTKKRNRDRIIGTIAGIITGIFILYLTENNIVLLAMLIVFMTGSYTFMRTNYLIGVSLMTPYLVLFYHLLNPHDFKTLLQDRVVDTLIGSAIAFIASNFLFPLWERNKIKLVMAEMLTEVKEYFSVVSSAFAGKTIRRSAQLVARKNALVALANLSDSFNRMINEPKSQQKGVEVLHQFVVLNHMLISYIAALSSYIQLQSEPYDANEFLKVAGDIKQYFENAISHLKSNEATEETITIKDSLRILNERANKLLQKRKCELEQGLLETSTRRSLVDLKSMVDQFNLIFNISVDMNKIAQTLQID